MKFKGEGWGGNVNLGGISIQLVFKAMRPEEVSKRHIGGKEVRTRPNLQAPLTEVQEMRKNHQRILGRNIEKDIRK